MRTLNELIRDLDAGPAQMATVRQAIYEAKKVIEKRKEAVDEFESDALAFVASDLDEKGKPKYTNKESREAAVRKRLGTIAGYEGARAQLTAAEIVKQNAEISLGTLEDTQKSLYFQLEAALAESRGETIRELTRCLLEFARLEALRLAQKESSHA